MQNTIRYKVNGYWYEIAIPIDGHIEAVTVDHNEPPPELSEEDKNDAV